MILSEIRNQNKTKGEYYIMPVYNKYLKKDWKVILSHATEMWDMGTPISKKNSKFTKII